MSLTIVQFTADLHRAGQQRVVVDLARGIRERGHRSIVCTTLSGGELEEELVSAGIAFRNFDLPKNYDIRGIRPVMTYLKRQRADAVITHAFYGSFVPRISAICSGIPALIHVEHNVSDEKRLYHVLINNIFSLFIDKIVCVSKEARRSLMKVEKVSARKVAVIPNGLNTERFSSEEGNEKPERKTKRVGIVGRFYEQKGHIYFVEAAARIARSYEKVEFVFAGDGPLRPFIEAKVREAGLESYCHFYGEVSDVEGLMRNLDVFVLPSLWEGLPISLLEAQYFGVPSVVTDAGGNSEIVRNGHNGLLVPPRDPAKLAAAVLEVLRNDNLRSEYGMNGKKLLEQEYSLDRMVDSYIELISDTLGRSGEKIGVCPDCPDASHPGKARQ